MTPEIREYTSPNYDERAVPVPSMIVLHYTGMKDARSALHRLCDPAAGVSAHYLIDEQGGLFRLVEEQKRAWHAGRSYWRGERDVNAASIGIELVNPGHEFGYRPFPEAQIGALAGLCRDILSRYDISSRNIVAHSDVAPERKTDPGELFPWKALAAQGIGVWPQEEEAPEKDARPHPRDRNPDIRQELKDYGYDPDLDEEILVTSFQRHFVPEIFGIDIDAPGASGTPGVACALTRRRLRDLHRTACL